MLPRTIPGAPPRPTPAIPPPGSAGGASGSRVGPWQLAEPLGPDTFRGVDAATGAPVVVKLARLGSPAEARLRREAQALRSLGGGDHPALVAAAGEHEGGATFAVATRAIRGVALDHLLAIDGPLDAADAARLLAPVADALADVHRRGWVHGDVSPGNVVAGPDGAVLVDLGSAHPAHPSGTDRDGSARLVVEATPGTAAPEVRAGAVATAASDVWSLAALVAVAVTGEPPTTGSPLPAPVALGLRRALADDPAERPRATELAAALAAVGAGGSPVAWRGDPVRPDAPARAERVTCDYGPRPVRAAAAIDDAAPRRRWWPALTAALVLAATTGWCLGRPAGRPAPSGPSACPAVAPLAGVDLAADVDGDGCTDALGWVAGVLTVRTAAGDPLRRYALAATDDAIVEVGDWDGDGIATPAITDPATGAVLRYDAWPTS